MTKRDPPKTHVQIRPGESSWDAMARELASNPDSPASLRIMSAFSQAMAPRQRASDQVVEALEAQMLGAGEVQDAAVAAAILHWEREFKESMPADTLADLTKEARQRIERQRRQPPAMESIVGARPATTDTGYKLGIHLEGLDGTWHRLWAIIATVHSFGHDLDNDESVATVRQQFQDLLGRSMTAAEWGALVGHAVHHAETTLKPLLPPLDDSSGA